MTDWVWIRPDWLWALIPWGLLTLGSLFYRPKQAKWHQLIAPHLQARMVEQNGASKSAAPLALLALFISILALAGPSVRTQESPLYSAEQARVLILDMSLSMWATDVKPNRLSRLRYKAMDFVNASQGGEMGLLAYSGDAFVVSPLTSDSKTLNNLISALGPDVMPAFGSRPDLAIEKAIELLSQAGHRQGSLVLMTDGISEARAEQIEALLAPTQYTLNIYQVGTEIGAPIQLPSGELFKTKGEIVLPTADHKISRRLSQALGGQLITMSHNSSDIERLAKASQQAAYSEAERQQQQAQIREDAGPYLLLLLVPLLALLFRKGALVALLAIAFYQPQPSYALGWQDLWQTQEQQAEQAFAQGDFETAAALSADPMRKGSALYRQGDYGAAQAEYEKLDTAKGHYNRGNALAQQQLIDEAIQAYQKALELEPGFEDAQRNKALLEQLKQQQEQQQGQDQQEGEQQNQDQQQSDSGEQSEDEQESGSQQEEQQQQSSEGESSDEEQQSSQSSKTESDEQQSSAQQEQQQASDAQSSAEQEQQSKDQQSDNSEQESSLEQQLAEKSEQQQAEAGQAKAQQRQAEQSEEASESDEQQGPVVASANEQQGEPAEAQTITDARLEALPDDPAILLRNKMQLEYQKRKAQGTQIAEDEVW